MWGPQDQRMTSVTAEVPAIAKPIKRNGAALSRMSGDEFGEPLTCKNSGHSRIAAILAEKPSAAWPAAALLDRITTAVQTHQQQMTEQFDDLSLPSPKARN